MIYGFGEKKINIVPSKQSTKAVMFRIIFAEELPSRKNLKY